MRKIFEISLLILIVLTSCSMEAKHLKEVCIVIPSHPWELTGEGDRSMWYNLVWTDKGQIYQYYVAPDVREVKIKVPSDETVFVCAYPLDSLRPFGGFFTPVSPNTITLNQNYGYLCDIIINGAPSVAFEINASLLFETASEKFKDFRCIEEATLLADILNGNLSSSSLNKLGQFTITDLEVYEGTWVSEYYGDLVLDPCDVTLPMGVHRYYNSSMNLMLSIAVNADGTYSKHEERALMPLAQT